MERNEAWPKKVWCTKEDDPDDTYYVVHKTIDDVADVGEEIVVGLYEFVGMFIVTAPVTVKEVPKEK